MVEVILSKKKKKKKVHVHSPLLIKRMILDLVAHFFKCPSLIVYLLVP